MRMLAESHDITGGDITLDDKVKMSLTLDDPYKGKLFQSYWTRICTEFANIEDQDQWWSQLIWISNVCYLVFEFVSTTYLKKSDWLTVKSGRGI